MSEWCKGVKTLARIPPFRTNEDLLQKDIMGNVAPMMRGTRYP